MPGHRSGLFWVNIGIPQGSPLSPILFALFTAGLLKALDETRILSYNFNGNVEKYAFATPTTTMSSSYLTALKLTARLSRSCTKSQWPGRTSMGHPSAPRSIASCTSSLQVSSSPSDPLAVHLLTLTAGPSRHNAAELLVRPNIQDLPHDVVEKVVRVWVLWSTTGCGRTTSITYVCDPSLDACRAVADGFGNHRSSIA